MRVVDTDVLIDFLRGRDPGAAWLRERLERGTVVRTTVVSRFELLAGARSDRQEASIRTLLSAVSSLPLDDGAADRAAAVRSTLEGQGVGIGMGDSLIAGIVLAADGTLVTRNTEHFRRVSDLRVFNPERG